MSIVSVSINDRLLEKLDELQDELGFSGRSEIVRTAIRGFLQDRQTVDMLEGEVNGVLLVTHSEDNASQISEIQHRFEDVIRTHLHDHLDEDTCLELFMVDGEAADVRSFWETLQASQETGHAQLITP